MECNEAQSTDDQMLVERDGKYELVNTRDVQLPSDEAQEREGSTALKSQGLVKGEGGRLSEKAVSSDGPSRDKGGNTEPFRGAVSNAPASVNHTVLDRLVEDQSNILSATSTHTLGRVKAENYFSSRTKSAPGLRNRDEQRRRNEAAYSAWLAAKNEELAKRREFERQQCKMEEEKVVHKQTLNDAAYQAWLEKKSQLSRQSIPRPATSVPKVDKAAKQAAFEAWLNSKREQQRRKCDEERERRLQEEEKAKNSDPTLVEQAYKKLVPYIRMWQINLRIFVSLLYTYSWLQQKSKQAKAEAEMKEQYRKAFFSESRRLHKSLQRYIHCHVTLNVISITLLWLVPMQV